MRGLIIAPRWLDQNAEDIFLRITAFGLQNASQSVLPAGCQRAEAGAGHAWHLVLLPSGGLCTGGSCREPKGAGDGSSS